MAIVAFYWIGAAVTALAINYLGKGGPTPPCIVGAIFGCQAAAVIHARQPDPQSSFRHKLILGLPLIVAASSFGFMVHCLVAPYPYPEITIPIAALGSTLFPFAVFDTFVKALINRREI